MRKTNKVIIGVALVSVIGSLLIAYQRTKLASEFDHHLFSRQTKVQEATKAFQDDLDKFKNLAEESLAWRMSALKEIHRLRAKIKSGVALAASDLRYLHEGVELYVNIRTPILAFAHKHKNMADDRYPIKFAPGKGSQLKFTDSSQTYIESVVVDPTDPLGDILIKQLKLSLAAALLLYDNFLIAIWSYHQDSKLRLTINYDNSKFLNSLESVTSNYLEEKYRKKINQAIKRVDQDRAWREAGSYSDEQDTHGYLDTLIFGSLTYREAKSPSWVSTRKIKITNWVRQHLDAFAIFRRESTNTVSALFGNTVGLIEVRKGKLLTKGKEFIQKIRLKLKPLDMLLEKTPFRLTDKLIPGHFGHVAIWLGSEDDLKAHGLWDDPKVRPYHSQIRSGHSVLEALRSGVQLSTLDHFMNIDDLAVVRLKDLSESSFRESIHLAVAQIGKAYDFNFDVETDKKIVCSELSYVVFPRLDWPVEKTAGRFTISPDNIASLVLARESDFEVPVLYHDGKQINGPPLVAIKLLLKGKYDKVNRL